VQNNPASGDEVGGHSEVSDDADALADTHHPLPSQNLRAAVKYLSHDNFLLESRRGAQPSPTSFMQRMPSPT
jgi:hypothetical protein